MLLLFNELGKLISYPKSRPRWTTGEIRLVTTFYSYSQSTPDPHNARRLSDHGSRLRLDRRAGLACRANRLDLQTAVTSGAIIYVHFCVPLPISGGRLVATTRPIRRFAETECLRAHSPSEL